MGGWGRILLDEGRSKEEIFYCGTHSTAYFCLVLGCLFCCCMFVCLGLLVGHKITGVRMILEDGLAHNVDSSENAFKAAAMGAMRTCKLPPMMPSCCAGGYYPVNILLLF